MKPLLNKMISICRFLLKTLALGIFSFQFVLAYEVTDLQIAGSGCTVPSGSHELMPVTGSVDRFGIPLMISLEKQTTPALARKTCIMSMKIKVGSQEKIQIMDASQRVKLQTAAGSKAASNLEVFLSGQTGTPLRAEVGSTTKFIKSTQVLNAAGVLAESECGKDAIIRANSSVLLQGATRSKVTTNALVLTLKSVRCQN